MRLRLDDIEGTELPQRDGNLGVSVLPLAAQPPVTLLLSPLVPTAMQSLLPPHQLIGHDRKSARLPALAGRDCPPDGRLHLVSDEVGETTLGWPLRLVSLQVRPDTGADAGGANSSRAGAGGANSSRADAGRADASGTDAGEADAGRADAGRPEPARPEVIEERLIAVYQFLGYTAVALVRGPSLAAHRLRLAALLRSGRPEWRDPDSGAVTALWDIWQ